MSDGAFDWVKSHSKFLIERFADVKVYESDVKLLSFFMAGSPGAGKTEVSKRLAEKFTKRPVLIDADEVRKLCPNYTGANAHLFQRAASKGVHILYDHSLHKSLNVIVDGTFAYGDSVRNIERSLAYARKVELYFVYQEPEQAWEFTKKREALESRRINKETFIAAFFKSRENVNAAKAKFAKDVELHLVIKNNHNDIERFEFNIDKVDSFIKKDYTVDDLNRLLL